MIKRRPPHLGHHPGYGPPPNEQSHHHTEEHEEGQLEVGDLAELEQHPDFGPTPALKVRLDAPALTHELPTRLSVCRTLPILSPERILPYDMRRAKATLLVQGQGARLARSIEELKAGGAGQIGVASSGTGAQFSTSGGGTGGFLLPTGLLVPLVVTCQDAFYACSDDYGVGNNPALLSIMIENWAD